MGRSRESGEEWRKWGGVKKVGRSGESGEEWRKWGGVEKVERSRESGGENRKWVEESDKVKCPQLTLQILQGSAGYCGQEWRGPAHRFSRRTSCSLCTG